MDQAILLGLNLGRKEVGEACDAFYEEGIGWDCSGETQSSILDTLDNYLGVPSSVCGPSARVFKEPSECFFFH